MCSQELIDLWSGSGALWLPWHAGVHLLSRMGIACPPDCVSNWMTHASVCLFALPSSALTSEEGFFWAHWYQGPGWPTLMVSSYPDSPQESFWAGRARWRLEPCPHIFILLPEEKMFPDAPQSRAFQLGIWAWFFGGVSHKENWGKKYVFQGYNIYSSKMKSSYGNGASGICSNSSLLWGWSRFVDI